MDIVFHTLVSLLFGKKAVLPGILPDLIGSTPFYFEALRRANSLEEFLCLSIQEDFFGTFDQKAYLYSHSWLTVLPFALTAKALAPKEWKNMSCAYILHLVIDIPTHSGNFAQQPFYPISKRKLNFGIYWAINKKIFFYFWLVLILVLLTRRRL